MPKPPTTAERYRRFGRWRTVSLTAFLSRAVAAGEQTPLPALGTRMAALRR